MVARSNEPLQSEAGYIDARPKTRSTNLLATHGRTIHLVSKKDMRVYIRQGLAPVLDAPVTIRDPDAPLGTHVYIAATTQNDGTSLGWSVVSMPPSTSNAAPRSSRPERARDPKAERAERLLPPSNAAQALERVEIPKDVRERISQLLWTGGSLIISDQPLSDETSDIGTDLVVTIR